MSFGEEVGGLISRGNKENTNSAPSNMLANEVTIYLDMLSAIIEDIVMCNLNSTLVVTIKIGASRMRNSHIRKKPIKPHKLLSSVSKSTTLSLSTRMSNKSLLLVTPSNERGAQEEVEPSSRMAASRIPYPIGIRKCMELETRLSGVVKTMKHSAFKITQNANQSIIMWRAGAAMK